MEWEVKWTEMCLKDMKETFLFYDVRNGNTRYSSSLYQQILSCVGRVSYFPYWGHPTEYPNVRYVVVEPKYSVFFIVLMKVPLLPCCYGTIVAIRFVCHTCFSVLSL